jgi:hypothetical protein
VIVVSSTENISKMSRFGDVEITAKKLPPVYGYHSQNLVSLEKAMEPIEPHIRQLSRYVKLAKEHCHFPSEHDLTHDESAAVYIYTMDWDEESLYRVVNQALRSENRQALKIWYPYLKLFDTALNKLPTLKEVVWRGVPLDIGKNFTQNQVLTWWTINSCSSLVGVVRDFLDNNKNSTLFLIEAINGKNISAYAEREYENEVILKMGTKLRVKGNSLNHPNGSHVVHLIEIDGNNDETSTSPPARETPTIEKPTNSGASCKLTVIILLHLLTD